MAKKESKQTQSAGEKQFDNANSGALFVNNKEGNEKRPDYTGKLLIKATDYEADKDGNVLVFLAAWERNSERVGKYLSLKAQPPQEK